MGKAELVPAMIALARGEFEGRPKTVSDSVRDVHIAAAQPFAIEADGEVDRGEEARFLVQPHALWVCP
jgi:diacylglycerol kinase family enzyme